MLDVINNSKFKPKSDEMLDKQDIIFETRDNRHNPEMRDNPY